MITVADVMTRQPATLPRDATVAQAAQLMDELNVGAVPVCDEHDHVLGIVTDRDITVRAIAAGLSPAGTPVEQVLSERVRCCSERQPVDDVLALMAAVQIRRLPVLDEAQRLVGMLSLGDLAVRDQEAAVGVLRRISTPSQPDRSGYAAH